MKEKKDTLAGCLLDNYFVYRFVNMAQELLLR